MELPRESESPAGRTAGRALHHTKNTLPEKIRLQVVEDLQSCLADTLDLMTQAKQAHWNVKGPSFIALHELFDQVAEDLEGDVDLIAERIVQLGGVAEGTVRLAAAHSGLPEYPLGISDGREHVEALSHALAYFGERVRAAIGRADSLGDRDTADILTEVSRGVDQNTWFVEAHGQAEK